MDRFEYFEYTEIGAAMLARNADRIQATEALVAATTQLHERHGWGRPAAEIVDDLVSTHWAVPAVAREYCDAACAAADEGASPDALDRFVCEEHARRA